MSRGGVESRRYRVAWVSVDGAGADEATFEDRAAAIAQARAEFEAAQAHGNPWGYRYAVRCEIRWSEFTGGREFYVWRSDGGPVTSEGGR